MKFDLSKSLAVTNPELVDEWHPELNGSLTPGDVFHSSHKKVWWVCRIKPSHVWSAEVKARHKGSKCPYCSGKKASIDYCLASINPELAEEWHPTKNEGLTPYDVVPNSYKMVWWKCKKCGNEWLARIAWRSYGAKCPECKARKKRSKSFLPERALSAVNPELAGEWHPVKNNGLTPDKISCTSSKKVWWICGKCGHEYEAKINYRQSHNSKCPGCKTALITMDKSLEEVNPGLASEWHPVLNGSLKPEDVSANSLMEAYWLCEKCGFEWKAGIDSRSSNNTGCSNCKEIKVLSPENCLAAVHPDLVVQWDKERNGSLTPCDVLPGNLRRVYWKCSKGHKYQMRISDKSSGMGCPVCRRRQNTRFPKQALFYYLKEVFGDTRRKYMYTTESKMVKLDIFIPSLNLGIEYDGYIPHMRPNSDIFDEQKNALLKDAIQLIRVREEGLPQINPFGSEVYVRNDTTKNTSLLKCLVSIGEYIKSNYNLSKEQLELVNGWSNADIDKDEAIIGAIIHKKVEKSMANLRPDLLEEWDYTKNGDLSPYSVPYGTSKKVWWICKTCGNSYEAQVRHRVKRFINGKVIDGTGCPKCGLIKAAEGARKALLARYASQADSRKECIK